MIWFILLATHAFFFCLGGLTFWFVTEEHRLADQRYMDELARSRTRHPASQ